LNETFHQWTDPGDGDEGEIRQAGLRKWARVIAQSVRDLQASNAPEWAATLAFYAFLFPLLLAGMVIASYVTDAAWATRQATGLLGQFLPHGQGEIEQIVNAAIADRRRAGLISLVILLVTGRRVLGALTKGLNLVSDVDEQDDPLRRRAGVELALLVGLTGLVLLALAIRPLLDLVWETLRIVPGPDVFLLHVAQGAVHIVLLVVIFTLVYVFVPRGDRPWRPAFLGAVVATVLFLIAQGIFRVLIDPLWDNFNLVYGPLAVAALLLSWTWYVGLITLAGGAFASHVKVMILQQESAHRAGEEHAEYPSP